jgi:hypothetical protein
VSGIYHVEISRADDDRLRAEFTVGELPDKVAAPFGPPPEGVRISVLVRTQANPQLLNVQLLALCRAEELIQAQIQAIRAAIEGHGA